ncbi:MAG: TetR/AcrR family transcriptional regulator [Lachnospiraceae bacterium]|nr:TetR/AcrR family transcriptional regulator [Lachnospiraceae bacterium]
MKKSPEITDATRNKLIQAFCELYEEKPISKITVKEITDIAGYNRSTFYQYFKDVHALLDYAEDEMVAAGMERVSTIQLEAPDFNQQLMLRLSEALQKHRYYTVLLRKGEVSSSLLEKMREHIILVMMERYHVSEDNTKAVLAMEFGITGMSTILMQWIKKPDELSVEELGSLVQGIWCNGLLAQLKQ